MGEDLEATTFPEAKYTGHIMIYLYKCSIEQPSKMGFVMNDVIEKISHFEIESNLGVKVHL